MLMRAFNPVYAIAIAALAYLAVYASEWSPERWWHLPVVAALCGLTAYTAGEFPRRTLPPKLELAAIVLLSLPLYGVVSGGRMFSLESQCAVLLIQLGWIQGRYGSLFPLTVAGGDSRAGRSAVLPMALGIAALFSLWVAFLAASSGSQTFESNGFSVESSDIIVAYFVAAALAGFLISLLWSWRQSAVGVALLGMVTAGCIYGAVGIATSDGLEDALRTGVALAFLVGPVGGLLVRFSWHGK